MVTSPARIDRDIAGLAIPALGALLVEPLFLLADTAMVGHLGQDALAALAVATNILQTLVGLMVFLAYATTPAVARHLGEGRRDLALTAGVSGMWLAALIGVVLLAVGLPTAGLMVEAFGVTPEVAGQAHGYLSASLWGVPAMLLVFAGTGVLRGLQDTRTTLLVSALGFGANIVLNAVLIYGAGLGVVGSGVGTALAQWGMAVAYILLVQRAARRERASLRPRWSDVGGVAASSWWLFLRTVSLRICVLATVWVAARMGTTETANYQIVATLFTTAAFALDSLAIAAQALVGKARGEGSGMQAYAVRLTRWGWLAGIVIGILAAALSPVLGHAFTSDPAVLSALPATILLMAAGLPLAGYTFILDGILIGAEDYRYLAVAMLVTLMIQLAAVVAITTWAPTGLTGALVLWASYGFVFMGSRALVLGPRAARIR